MNPNIIWPVVTGGFLVAFGVFEALAIRNGDRDRAAGKPSGTYTAWIRRTLGLDPARWWRPIGIAGFASFMVWFFGHILFGIWNA
ncbi:hypothetical protein [Amycolatopsis thermoflava]|uniref:hypothetical protein n=1 Tax=Amycolatopsis thermoflava TaxID=84480 RepID=UPI0004012027|nr:hypothetical protein [Amycolatopsis thermoflava]